MGRFVIIALTGLIAGFLASRITRDRERGVLGMLLVGVCGSVLGFAVFNLLGLNARNWIGMLVTSTVGASLLCLILQGLRKRRR